MSQLDSGTLKIGYTKDIVTVFKEIEGELDQLETLPGLEAVVDHLFPNGQDKTHDIRELAIDVLSKLDNEDRNEFIRELSVAIDQPEIPTEIEHVRIMSLHKSKGLSSPVTIIAGCVQGLLPRLLDDNLSSKEKAQHLEEQRRLFYVGITRVKSVPADGKPGTLLLTYSQKMPTATALSVGIMPAKTYYNTATLHASEFIRELGPAAPRPIAG